MKWKNISSSRGGTVLTACILMICLLAVSSLTYDAWIFTSLKTSFSAASRSAMRSVAAGCEDDLLTEYGIFAYDIEQNRDNVSEIFKNYLNGNMTVNGLATVSSQKLDIENISISNLTSLLDGDELRLQIVDIGSIYSKVLFTDETAEIFTKLFGDFSDCDLPDSSEITSTENVAATSYFTEDTLNSIINLFKNIISNGGEMLRFVRPDWVLGLSGENYDTEGIYEDINEDINEDDFNVQEDLRYYLGLITGNTCVEEITGSGGMLDRLKCIIEIPMDKLSIVSYVLEHFSYMGNGERTGRFFNTGEIEYILCGRQMQISNIAAAAYETFLLRFVIDTLTLFIKNGNPDPASGMIAAAAEGTANAIIETCMLLSGESIEIIPAYSIIKADYKFHLALLLSLKVAFDEHEVLMRIKRIIQVNLIQKNNLFRLRNMIVCLEYDINARAGLPLTKLIIKMNKKGKAKYGELM